MRRHQITVGSHVKLRGNDYMQCRVRRILEPYRGRAVLVECECTADGDFRFGLIKTFRMVDLRPVLDTTKKGC